MTQANNTEEEEKLRNITRSISKYKKGVNDLGFILHMPGYEDVMPRDIPKINRSSSRTSSTPRSNQGTSRSSSKSSPGTPRTPRTNPGSPVTPGKKRDGSLSSGQKPPLKLRK